MNYYQEITLIPDAEISLGFIWHKLYQQLHIALVENKTDQNNSAVAVGFPLYGKHAFPLGNKLRLFAVQRSELERLNITSCLSRFEDYLHIRSIQAVPENATHVCFVRQHKKGQTRINKDMQSKAELWAAKSGKSLQTCLSELENSKPSAYSNGTFIWMESQQTKKHQPDSHARFPLFIKRIEVKQPQTGRYNCYGLGYNHSQVEQIASTPHF